MRVRSFLGVLSVWGVSLLAGSVLLAGPAEEIFEGLWSWTLPPRKYGLLSQAERLQYEAAEKLMREGKFEAAALEYEKFVTANPQTPVYGHALLMQGLGYHLARFRNKAIQRYNEVLDFFGKSLDEAVPAAYLKGLALIQNGNVESGIAVWQEMTDRRDAHQHPLADLMLNRLADHYAQQEKWREAEQCWTRIVDNAIESFVERPEGATAAARQKLTDLYCRQGRLDDADRLLLRFPLPGAKSPAPTVFIFDRALAVFDSIPEKHRRSLFEWARMKRPLFAEAGRMADWYNRILTLAVRSKLPQPWGEIWKSALEDFKRLEGRDSLREAVQWMIPRLVEATQAGFPTAPEWKAFREALSARLDRLDAAGQLAVIHPTLDRFPMPITDASPHAEVWSVLMARARDHYLAMMNPERDNGLAGLCDRYRQARQFDRAMEMVRRIETPPLALWKEIEVLGAQEKWADQAEKCEELEKMDDKTYSLRALRLRASLYKDRLARYEEAIKLYAMINDPPGTIWATVDCYERMGKPEKAEEALTEIENFFERDAPQAALRKAQVWERAKNREKTVAALRAVMKKYPQHPVSSQAHQWLERLGVATGGGIVDEDL